HSHGQTRGTADLNGMSVGGANAEMLGEHGREHDVRRHRGIAAEDAVDLGACEAGVSDGELGGLAHEIERGEAFVLAVGGKTDAGDVAHQRASCSAVIPGRREASSPESISTARLGPFAQSTKNKRASLSLPQMRQAASAVLSMDSGLALRAPRNDDVEGFARMSFNTTSA